MAANTLLHKEHLNAKEKGGIIKPGIPLIIGPRVPLKPIQEIAFTKGSPLQQIEGSFDHYIDENNRLAKVALEHLSVPAPLIVQALQTQPPCRMEVIHFPKRFVILDVAHNPDGLQAILKAIQYQYPGQRFPCILGLSQSKDIKSCLKVLIENVSHLYLVKAASPRAAAIETLTNELDGLNYKSYTRCSSVKEALSLNESPLLITGTFFMMAEARDALGLREPRDPVDLNERIKKEP